MYDVIVENARVVTVTSRLTLVRGGVAIAGGKFARVGPTEEIAPLSATHRIDARGLIMCPGLVDCHTHLFEYATVGVHGSCEGGQMMAGIANLFTARQSGIVATGEHHLGHPALSAPTAEYRRVAGLFPGYAHICAGFCVLGTADMVVTSSSHPGRALRLDDLSPLDLEEMAENSDFPGESLFLTATPANLPVEQAPRAGEPCFSFEQIKGMVGAFHAAGKRVGAHVEGSKVIDEFLRTGGDVVHHGHGLTEELAVRMAGHGADLVATPHGGTSSRPNSPEDIAMAVRAGVKTAIASDAYLPKHPGATWLAESPGYVYGPQHLMAIASPAMRHLRDLGYDENEVLALLTRNGAEIMGISDRTGSIEEGKDATFLLARGIPGLDITDPRDIVAVYIQGKAFRGGLGGD